jgi:hypothetical protein
MATANDKGSKAKSRKVRLILTVQVPFDMSDTKVINHVNTLLTTQAAIVADDPVKVSRPKVHKDAAPA